MKTAVPDVVVIGGGVIGLSTALELQGRGLAVTVIERDPDGHSASIGNAGAFAFSDVEPLAAPGIMRRAPGWLLDPLGPLSIPPAYALRIAPWMLRFWRASWRDRHAGAVQAQAALMAHSQTALERLVTATDAGPLLRREGQLQLYDNAASFRASLNGWENRRAHDITFELIEDNPARIAELQPGLDARFRFAAFTPDWFNVTDPGQWHAHLRDCFLARGGQFRRANARALRPSLDHVDVETDGTPIRAGNVVLAAGAWSHHLARTMGERLPLETERGYNTTLPDPRFKQKTHLSFADHGFVVTKVGQGIRVGGAVELGGLHLPPNYRRADVLLDKAKAFLPGLNAQGGTQWMGFRPSMPDSLPVIGRSITAARVIHAFGHGHLGLTQSAGTATLVADLVTGVRPAIALAPYRPDRFAFARFGKPHLGKH
ncbi:FAD-binding oxidoreductase [Roseinatronobacter sp. S2]|uniref:NAD(P)/FAD-dependent oxidoreductase n=1 Tax=Roseinatronobacter sp. S2 TaxID=3035471 RepID=UPI0024103618|nr:FAD-dependent oxidoreductase [Roseinatronobacter sp. S2]WFE74687.1 FAD-dependent oxidoreductase [Roseinatronobacter sp. S2]